MNTDWTFIGFIIALVVLTLGMMVVAGWMDLEQNKIINECIRAGKTWKDGNCE